MADYLVKAFAKSRICSIVNGLGGLSGSGYWNTNWIRFDGMDAYPSIDHHKSSSASVEEVVGVGPRAVVGDHPSVGLGDMVWHTLMFWFLTLMSVLLFIPCVLVPVWIDGESIREHERALSVRISEMEAQVSKNDIRINALLSDPLVNERVIRREFNYSPAYEHVFRWSVSEDLGLDKFSPAFGSGSQIVDCDDSMFSDVVLCLRRWLPSWPWRFLFFYRGNRYLLLFMSGGVLLSAFLLYGPPQAGVRRLG
ncbi:MAG: hypothetical protein ACYTF1_12215 [Planctomycetota bacterium]|jgi:hypothetical protein